MTAVFFSKDEIYTQIRLITDTNGEGSGTADRSTQTDMVNSARSMLYNKRNRNRRKRVLGQTVSVIYSEVFFIDKAIEEKQYLKLLVKNTEENIYSNITKKELHYIIDKGGEEYCKNNIKKKDRYAKAINIEKTLIKIRNRIKEL